MKKLLLLLIFIAGFVSLNAQNPNDLAISGYVTNANGLAIANQQVCVHSDSLGLIILNQCVYTNSNGWYNIIITNGSVVGANHNYTVTTANCNGTVLSQVVSNNQGTVHTASVNFTICAVSCVANFTYTQNGDSVAFNSSSSGVPGGAFTYSWNFGDGSTSYHADPSHIYSANGTYNVCLTIANNNGCSDTYCQTVVVNQNACGLTFTYTQNPNGVYHFVPTITSTIPNATYLWNFGDGVTSTNHDPSHTYANHGNYSVCLTVTGSGMACTYCDSVYFINSPSACNANFSYQISGLSVAFTSVMANTIVNYTWDFGNGTTSTLPNPTITYTTAGQYNVCLHVMSSYCSDTICQTITVGTATSCNVTFTYTTLNLQPNQVHFQGHLTPNSGTNTCHWDFGDGQTITGGLDPYHTYSQPGNYVVCLYISQSNGNITCSYCDSIYVPGQSACGVSFTYTQTPNGIYHFTPVLSSTIPNPQYLWTFGDGQTSTLYDPSNLYATAGHYTVCLTVTGSGMTCTYCDSAYFSSPNGCNANFTYQSSGLSVAFTSLMTNSAVQYLWDFGNGTTSTMSDPTITYAAAGQYTVCLHIWTNNCADSVCQAITVGNNTNCNVSFTYSSQNLLPNQIQFFGMLTPNSATTVWNWSFGDGISVTGHQDPIHQYSQPGNYFVCVYIVQSNGNITCSFCDSVIVTSTPPVTCNANFTYQQNGTTLHFFVNNSGISPSTTTTYLWDFGDGTTSTLYDPTHSFTNPGTYTVCLTVTDMINNCTAQFCQNIIIGTNTSCQASFQYSYGAIYNVAFFGNFTPLSTYLQWYWSFGDSTFSSIQNPVHSYAYPGTYQVCLTVVSPNCPASTICQTITIQGNNANCQAYFTYQVNNANVHFHAINSSSTPNQYMNYFWTFGDSTTSTLIDPIHTYSAMGTYTVCLTITDSINGCQDQFCQTITLGSNAQLGGQIFAGNDPADAGTVYLLSVTPNSPNAILPVASTPIQPGGYYSFSNIPYGQYLIQAHLDPSSIYYFGYLPTYYGDVLYWSQANFVTIGQVNLTIQYDIHLIGTQSNSGNGQIGGNVWSGNGSKATLGGVLVILLDENNVPVTYTYSDAYGTFLFKNLAFGTYKVYAEVWGKDPVSASVTLDANNTEVNDVLILVNDATVIASIPGDHTYYFDFVGNPYPNPASDIISLEMSLKLNANLDVTIYNIMGASVLQQKYEYASGVHNMKFNINNLPAGLYYIDIVADNKLRVSKMFNKIK